MEEFFYNGIWRMDWGLGNPNKTAILIAELMIASWGLIFIERWKTWSIWCVIVINLMLGACLLHTFSRGGMVALFVGLSGVGYVVSRRLACKDYYAIACMIFLLLFFSFYLNGHKRYLHGIVREDRSITNRLAIWKQVPQMMVAAPRGWGWGESGKTFMRWYQDTGRSEPYRTLVSSHFTWLVEFGWPLRFLYIALWLAAVSVCFPVSAFRWNAVTLGELLCLGTGMLFSSVGETPLLWLVPALFLLFSIGNRWLVYRNILPVSRMISIVILSGILCLSFLLPGLGGRRISYDGRRTIVGGGEPSIWLVRNDVVLGEYAYARALRDAKYPDIGIVDCMGDLPVNSGNASVILAGKPRDDERWLLGPVAKKFSKVLLLSPAFSPEELGADSGKEDRVSVWFGSLSQSAYRFLWEMNSEVSTVSGCQDFIPDWPAVLNAE